MSTGYLTAAVHDGYAVVSCTAVGCGMRWARRLQAGDDPQPVLDEILEGAGQHTPAGHVFLVAPTSQDQLEEPAQLEPEAAELPKADAESA